ncbi:MAG: 16S rRNA (cytidine(1402)-2'-O)-methyltransferase [Flavobacteriales bacterium]|nr:16S rRNA (cytidine(1402)-2'-O)-methyltransferase [Flavobacteriales bacterium]
MSGGKLVVVPTPVGNLGDMTPRALEVLSEAHMVLAEDTRTTGKLLRHFGIETPLRSFHQHNEHRALEGVVSQLQGGVTLALCSDAGTPGISDPGFLLVRACVDAGVAVECLPGATAFVPALVTSGLPCDRFYFEGFLPHKKGRQKRLTFLLDMPCTVVMYESPHRVAKLLDQLHDLGAEDRPVALCREISKLHEETLRGTVSELKAHLAEHAPRGEYVVVLGTGDQNTTR